MPRFCSSCGVQLPDKGKFCPRCGQPIVEEPTPQPQGENNRPSDQGWQQPQNQGWQQPQNQGRQQPQNQGWQQPQNQGRQQPQNQGWQQSVPSSGTAAKPKKKKSSAGLIVCLVVLLLAGLGAVGGFVWPGFLKETNTEPATTASVPVTVPQTAETTVPVATTVPATEPQTTAPVVTEPAVTEFVNPFLDVIEDDPCFREFLWAYTKGVIAGGLLDGARPLTRGEAMLLLWKALDCPTADQNELPFSDVTVSDECYPAVLWAYSSHLISGSGEGTFSPNDGMTRNQAAAILCKAVGGDGAGLPRAYLDVGPDQYCYDPVNWGCAAGLFERYYDFSFLPTDPIQRADFICWLARAVEPTLALDGSVPEGDDLASHGIAVNLQPDGEAAFTVHALEDSSVSIRMRVSLESYSVFTEAQDYPAREGYEWRQGVFLVTGLSEENSAYTYDDLYADVNDACYVDLFEYMREYYEDSGVETSWVIYNDVPYEVTVLPMNVDVLENGYRVSYTVQVPMGYDGICVRFYAGEHEPGEMEFFYDKLSDPTDYVLFRYR